MNPDLKKELKKLSRPDLNKRATEQYKIVDADKLPNAGAVIEAIATAINNIEVNSEETVQPQAELPAYESTKKVGALEIELVQRKSDGSATITPANKDYKPFEVSAHYMRRFNARAGGYYLVYEDGTLSYQTAKHFKEGYEKV